MPLKSPQINSNSALNIFLTKKQHQRNTDQENSCETYRKQKGKWQL